MMLKLIVVVFVCLTTIVGCSFPSISTWELNKLRTLKDRFVLVERATGMEAALLAGKFLKIPCLLAGSFKLLKLIFYFT